MKKRKTLKTMKKIDKLPIFETKQKVLIPLQPEEIPSTFWLKFKKFLRGDF